MSIPVALPDLAAAISEYGFAYLLTVRDDLRAHIVAVTPAWEGECLVMDVGRGTARQRNRTTVDLALLPTCRGGWIQPHHRR